MDGRDNFQAISNSSLRKTLYTDKEKYSNFRTKIFGFYFRDVSLWPNISTFKVDIMVNLLTVKPPRAGSLLLTR